MRDDATRVVRVAPARQPARKYRKASRGFRGATPLPWCRLKATAISGGRLPIARAEISAELAGPWLSLHKTVRNVPLPIPTPPQRSGGSIEKKPQDVSWFTEHLSRLGLNLPNFPKKPPAIVRSARRHR